MASPDGSAFSSRDELDFQDIPHVHGMSSDEDYPTKHKPSQPRQQPPVEDNDEEADQSKLLEDGKPPPSFWTFEYYQQFFDVDTAQVVARILGSMLPFTRSNFLKTRIRPNPDLYGPFWICTTLVFTTAIAGNLANFIATAGADYTWHYNFHQVTFAATAIYCYWWLIPTLVWGVLRWRQSPAGYSFLEIICVYGYSLAVYVPISILWVIPFEWLRWLLVALGMVLSGSVLLITFWPAVSEDDKKIAIVLMVLIIVFHGALAAGFKLYFFNTSIVSPSNSTVQDLLTTVSTMRL